MVSHCACPTRGVRDRALHEHRRPSSLPSHGPKCPFKELLRGGYVLLDIRLQMPRSCLPIIPRVADAVGAKDEFV
jgi:hypothetical protein